MIELLNREISKHSGRFQVVSVERLRDLQKDIEDFRKNDGLNPFQKYITGDLYRFEPPVAGFEIRSLIIVASPTPAYAKIIFHRQGRKIAAKSLARSFLNEPDAATATRQYLTKCLKPGGYHVQAAQWVPLKRLAVRSGLAEYGRNNICYVPGMGSFLTLVAYFSDIPCTEDEWQEVRQMDPCRHCSACLKNCPTGAILKDRFLIDNERCLSYFNESPGDFPDWLPESAHHCIYDCLKCQTVCPLNKDYIGNVIGPIEFDEAETEALLSGKSIHDFTPALRKKVKFLGMDEWMKVIPRNIKMLLDQNLRS